MLHSGGLCLLRSMCILGYCTGSTVVDVYMLQPAASVRYPLQEVCELPQAAAVTSVDASNHPVVGDVASGRSEIAALALWLMAERISPASKLAPFVQALPVCPLPEDAPAGLSRERVLPVLE